MKTNEMKNSIKFYRLGKKCKRCHIALRDYNKSGYCSLCRCRIGIQINSKFDVETITYRRKCNLCHKDFLTNSEYARFCYRCKEGCNKEDYRNISMGIRATGG